MTDRELLELAAKAAGIEICFGPWPMRYVDAQDQKNAFTVKWNPLDDDGDALRLAAKLRINIDFKDCCAWSRGVFGLVQEFWGGDYPNCYRNAIVRAAAEIGKEQA